MPFIVRKKDVAEKLEEIYGVKLSEASKAIIRQAEAEAPRFEDEPTKPYYWSDSMLINGYEYTLNSFYGMYPDARDTLPPCLINQDETRNSADKSGLLRAYRALGRAMAGYADRYTRYQPAYREDARAWLEEEVEATRNLWEPYLCEKRRKGKEAKK